jgi:hypothetical protein
MLVLFVLLSSSLAQIPPGPALPPSVYLGNITFSIDDPLEGDNIEIRSSIVGNQTIPLPNLTVHLFIDQVEVKNLTGIGLESMENKSIVFDWQAEKWTHLVMLTVDQGASPIPGAMVTATLTVEAKPIGDLNTLISLLSGIALFILIIVISPSIFARLRR